jgi:hypothetical protein
MLIKTKRPGGPGKTHFLSGHHLYYLVGRGGRLHPLLFAARSAAPPPTRMTELTFDRAGYVDLLRKLIGENRNLQNNPPTNVPQEDLASDHVLRVLGTKP